MNLEGVLRGTKRRGTPVGTETKLYVIDAVFGIEGSGRKGPEGSKVTPQKTCAHRKGFVEKSIKRRPGKKREEAWGG